MMNGHAELQPPPLPIIEDDQHNVHQNGHTELQPLQLPIIDVDQHNVHQNGFLQVQEDGEEREEIMEVGEGRVHGGLMFAGGASGVVLEAERGEHGGEEEEIMEVGEGRVHGGLVFRGGASEVVLGGERDEDEDEGQEEEIMEMDEGRVHGGLVFRGGASGVVFGGEIVVEDVQELLQVHQNEFLQVQEDEREEEETMEAGEERVRGGLLFAGGAAEVVLGGEIVVEDVDELLQVHQNEFLQEDGAEEVEAMEVGEERVRGGLVFGGGEVGAVGVVLGGRGDEVVQE